MDINQFDEDTILIAKMLAMKEAKETAKELGFEFFSDEEDIVDGIYRAILLKKYGITE